MKLTREDVRAMVDALPEDYKTKDLDGIIARLVREKADVSALRPHILTEQDLHRIYFYVSLKQIKDVRARMRFIDENLLFSDWWHTDPLIHFVADMDFSEALDYAKRYVVSEDPYIRRWGYVLFISTKLCCGHVGQILPLIKNDPAYTVQMAEAWLISELAIFEPAAVLDWMRENGLSYAVNGKAIQKISDSFRISDADKEAFKTLRPALKSNPAGER